MPTDKTGRKTQHSVSQRASTTPKSTVALQTVQLLLLNVFGVCWWLVLILIWLLIVVFAFMKKVMAAYIYEKMLYNTFTGTTITNYIPY